GGSVTVALDLDGGSQGDAMNSRGRQLFPSGDRSEVVMTVGQRFYPREYRHAVGMARVIRCDSRLPRE
ncbi:MAG: hypothetical protein MUF51_11630, partial [Vicinamibacteria bacterium]|nr:hypothetical protein [Vicinamibacteria bacterium]